MGQRGVCWHKLVIVIAESGKGRFLHICLPRGLLKSRLSVTKSQNVSNILSQNNSKVMTELKRLPTLCYLVPPLTDILFRVKYVFSSCKSGDIRF